MIGPHEGKELDLMLKGQKPFAMFHDIAKSEYTSPEGIIPEQLFSIYVTSGQVIRKEKVFHSNKHPNEQIKYVCFALPDQSWRIDTFFWILNQFYNGDTFPNHADDIMIGRLLGYSKEDIDDYLTNLKERSHFSITGRANVPL